MHRTRTADSQVIAERPFVFVCTPLLDQEYAQASCSIEIIERELSPLLCKSHEAKLPVKHALNWLYQWFWIWNALRHSIPFVTDAFGRKSIWVFAVSRLRGCADVCMREKAHHLLPSQVISLTDPRENEIRHSRSASVLVKSEPLNFSILATPSFFLISLNSKFTYLHLLQSFADFYWWSFIPVFIKRQTCILTYYRGCIAWWLKVIFFHLNNSVAPKELIKMTYAVISVV